MRGRRSVWRRLSPRSSPGWPAGEFLPDSPVTNGLPGTRLLIVASKCHGQFIEPIAVTLVHIVKKSSIQIYLDEEGHRTDRDQSQQNLGNQNFAEDFDGDSTLRAYHPNSTTLVTSQKLPSVTAESETALVERLRTLCLWANDARTNIVAPASATTTI